MDVLNRLGVWLAALCGVALLCCVPEQPCALRPGCPAEPTRMDAAAKDAQGDASGEDSPDDMADAARCDGDACEPVCPKARARCGVAGCRDLMNDPAHCGACDRRCTFPNGRGACHGGSCRYDGCDAGYVLLGGSCVRCGAVGQPACPTDQCAVGATSCGGVCSDLLRDSMNCGACGRACVGMAACVAGRCPMTGAISLSMSDSHACAVLGNRQLWCWGDNRYGYLGVGDMTMREGPVRVPLRDSRGAEDAAQVVTGLGYTCARTEALGELYCWGVNTSGHLGVPEVRAGAGSRSPGRVPLPGRARDVAAGVFMTCAVLLDGSVHCWGSNENRRLGVADSSPVINEPRAVTGISTAVAVTVGSSHACALLADRTIRCWGDNTEGQLGIGRISAVETTATPVTGTGYSAVVAGAYHTCAMTESGGVWCWGANHVGQVGAGTTMQRNHASPTLVSVSSVTALVAGEAHVCARTNDGAGWCWGSNRHGQLGQPLSTEHSSQPLRSFADVGRLAAGERAVGTCVVPTAGPLRCLGFNGSGQLAGFPAMRSTPAAVEAVDPAPSAPLRVTTIRCGFLNACALRLDRTLSCWGSNSHGQIGDGFSETTTPRVGRPPGIEVTGIAVGAAHTCAIASTGTVQCWGFGGATGDGLRTSPVLRPAPVGGTALAASVVHVSAGYGHSCATRADGVVWCWGANFAGQLGLGRSGGGEGFPAQVMTPVRFRRVEAGDSASCGISNDSQVWCWGGFSTAGSTTPQAIMLAGTTTPLADVVDLDVGSRSCAVRRDGRMFCWGEAVTEAREEAGVTNVVGVAITRGASTCALLRDGTVRCWGNNDLGQLGDGTRTARMSPTQVVGLRDVVAISAGDAFVCAQLSDNTVRCWGANDVGQLGEWPYGPEVVRY